MKTHPFVSIAFILLLVLATVSCKKDNDDAPPVIKLNGFNPYTVCVGSPYVDAGATATDDQDGDLTDEIDTKVQVDTSEPGEGTVTYEVSDAAGNKATAVRVVTVIYCRR